MKKPLKPRKNRKKFLTKSIKAELSRTFETKKGQKRVKSMWSEAYDAWYWLEDYRLP